MSRLKRGLRNHPGIEPLSLLTLLGFVAGCRGDSAWSGPLGAAIMGGLAGIPVLITAWQAGKENRA